MKANERIAKPDTTPIMTFHSVSMRALGWNFVITRPAVRIPNADAVRLKLPVRRLETEELVWYRVSISFGV
jgi:hypothetical protein